MKKGFTLLELIVVMIIVGILATLGITQYQTVIEKSRGAEARQVLGVLRSVCAGFWMQDSNTNSCSNANLGISTNATIETGRIPGTSCWGTNYFRYGVGVAGSGNTVTLRAIRCTTGGKNPPASTGGNLDLTINYGSGSDVWSSTAGY
jgi:prepilin-type N-terminal cleavage/methylation domain-containing protein